ncbi:MAG: tryptophanase, partial [Acidimicrobiia bacterium]
MRQRRTWAEPWKIKMIEPIRMTTREEREDAARAAGYNTFLLRSDDVYIDLLTDSGTSAMSDNQWAGLMLGDEAYAGSKSFYHLVDAVRDVYGYEELIPTHQGRGAEHILSQILISDGDVIPGNMYFTTTKFHQEYAGGRFVDVIIDEAHDPYSDHPFKGNIDIDKLQAAIDTYGADRIPYISVEANVNMAGGQPMSMANLRAVSELCRANDILVMLDATRAIENAWFIKQREGGYSDRSVAEILREMCGLTDGATMSSKKDNLVNIGGFLALRDPELARKARALLVAFEGLHTYGGMSGRDMEAL